MAGASPASTVEMASTDEQVTARRDGAPPASADRRARAEELRALIREASESTVIVRRVDLDLAGRRVKVTLVTPDLLTLQDVLDELRTDAFEGESARDFNGRYMRRLVPKIAYSEFDADQMEGALIFPRGHSDPVYRRLTRHPTAFATLTMAAAEVVRPLQTLAQAGSSSAAPAGTREAGAQGAAGTRGTATGASREGAA
ncbi:MAG: hypothetical protein ABR599_05995 [Gemmatimonadota bacterium]